jgi:acetyltransferase-like isoleucine patch superfamily enzyme
VDRRRRLLHRGVQAAWAWLDRAGQIVPGTDAAEAFGSFGPESCIGFPAATLMNVGSIHLGARTLVGRQATLSVGYGPGETHLPARALVIGDRCVIGARAAITAHSSITIGDDVWCGQDVFVSDAGHGYQELETPIGRQLGEHHPVVIGSGTWIGHGAIILPGARIGRNVVVAAGSVVRGTVEDRSVVGGAPARTIRRYVEGVGWVTADGDVRPVLAPFGDGLDLPYDDPLDAGLRPAARVRFRQPGGGRPSRG